MWTFFRVDVQIEEILLLRMCLGLMHWDSVEGSEDSWVKNSGASFHATHSSEALQNLKVGDFGKVRLVNDECSLYKVGLPSEGVTVPVQKRNKVRFTESHGQKRVTFCK